MPPGLVYAPGTAHVDGQPVSDETIANLTFSLGSLAAGRMVEAGISATVAVPTTGRYRAADRCRAALERRRAHLRAASSRSASHRASAARATIVEADRGVAQAREELDFTVHVFNDGTAPEPDVRLRLIPGLHLEDLRIGETADDTIPYDEPIALGFVHPHQERVFTVRDARSRRVCRTVRR